MHALIKLAMMPLVFIWIMRNVLFTLFIVEGYLCGQCRDDKGVSVLLNNCVSCGYVNILLIIALGQYNLLRFYT